METGYAGWLSAGLALLVVLFGRWWRARGFVASGRSAGSGDGAASFRCVSVRACERPCVTARSIAGRRFLPGEAPPLPLEDCGLDLKGCVYEHFEDRRFHNRRRARQRGDGKGEIVHYGRRSSNGRRMTDRLPPGYAR